MYSGLKLALAALALSLLSGCGRDPELGIPPVPVPFEPATTGVTSFGDVPWPSDLYLDGGHMTDVPGLERIATLSDSLRQGLAALDGFGRSTGAIFFLDPKTDVDAATLPHDLDDANADDASVLLVDVDTASPKRGTRYPAIAKALPSIGALSVIPVPGYVLPLGVRHAAVLTNRVATVSGAKLGASDKLSAIVATAPAERATPIEKLYGGAVDEIVKSGAASRDSIASLAVFTTSRRVEELPHLRARLRSLPEPALVLDPAAVGHYSVAVFGVATTPSLDDWLGIPDKDDKGVEWPGGDNPHGIAHDAIGAVVSGAFVAPSLLDATTHHFEEDAGGEVKIADPNAMIPVTIVLPKAPPPANGYPVIINGHGLSNNRGSMLSVANELARAGFAMIGIDDVLHGARAGIVDEKNNYHGKYAGPDGIPDDYPLALGFFAGFSDFIAVRDNFRQTVLDQTSLVRLIQSSKLDLSSLSSAVGGFTPKLDGSSISWSGGSLGGIMGAMTIAVEPEIHAAALQVPGASFVQLITTSSAKVSPLVSTVAQGTFGLVGDETLDEFHPLALLLGAITEAGDPIAYAPHVMQDPIAPRQPPDVMVTYAIGDEVLPNIATHALLRALGADLAEPKLIEVPGLASVASPVHANRGARTIAAVQYSPANHGLGYGRYDVREFVPGVPLDGEVRFPPLDKAFKIEMPIREHEAQLVKFLSSARSGAATIEVTAPPIADFDGDGVVDSKDAKPADPTVH